MPANHRQPAAQTPASPNTKSTARYTNKDGSKIITVPKGPPSAEPSQPSTPTSSAKAPSVQTLDTNGADPSAPTVNRKKQKRRAKAAAKAAAEQAAVQPPNGRRPSPAPGAPAPKPQVAQDDEDQESSDDEPEDHHSTDDRPHANGFSATKSKKSKKKKKKNGKNPQLANSQYDSVPFPHSHSHSPLTPRGPGISKDKIWNTSSQEERERIKEFWLGLGEDERKSLVKVEKDAVLKKMKEQQKHTCSCTVCGRKRTAIEEELEGLYDAYYEELETFANNGEGPHILPPHREFPLRPSRIPSSYTGQPPSRGRIVEHVGDDDDEEEPEEEYSDEDEDLEEEEEEEEDEEDDEYSDEDEPPEDTHPHDRDVADFLTFGNSLQVKGGILTVADDLLKNDGKRFIEMMEQLAERRMAREEDAKEHFSRGYTHPANGSYSNHDHPPPEDDYDDEDEEEDEDYDDSQEEEYEDEEDTMTEEQRMEEGRRMFQIFAARMFEQRVLTAYRDMVAKQRQQQLIEELEEENRQTAQKKAKKAKENQKRKDKAALKKQQQAEEKARKEAEKAAEEAARLEEQRRKVEEQRMRAEEKRRKKEEQKRLEEEERLRKETDRQRRLQEQQEKRAEQERKARESREKTQKLKEEARLREQEIRDQKDKELRERKEKQEQAKRDKEAKAKAEKESKDRIKQEEKAAQKAATVAAAPIPIPTSGRRLSQHPVPIPTHPSNPASYASPKIPVATPALPKAPTPIRPKHASQPLDTSLPESQASRSGSTASQNPSPHPATPGRMSPGPIGSWKTSVATTNSLPHPNSISPSSMKGPMQPGPFGMPMSMPPPGFNPPPGLGNRLPDPNIFGPPGITGFGRPPPPLGMMAVPPGLNGPAGRGFMPGPPPGFPQPMGDHMQNMAPGPGSHSRQHSGSFDPASSPIPTQPIGRPAPIGRPGSVVQGHRNDASDDFTNQQHLGSSVLVDDASDPMNAAINAARHRSQLQRSAFPLPFDNGFSSINNSLWGPSPMSYTVAPGAGNSTWGSPTMMQPMPPIRTAGNPRSVTIRLMMCRACKELQARNPESSESFVDLAAVKAEVDQLNRTESVPEVDLLALAETEGNLQNGGGTFEVQLDANGPGQHLMRWVPEFNDMAYPAHRPVGAPGEIGSPIIGSGAPAFLARGH